MENELMDKLDLLFENSVNKTVDNEMFKIMLLEIIEERKKYKEIIKQYPNDSELGRIIRSKFNTK